MSGERRWVVAVAAFVVAALVGLSAASALSRSYPNDFADPSVVFTGGRYWAYATGSGGNDLQAMSSTDLRTWSAPTNPLLKLPLWAVRGYTWHPSVVLSGALYVMFYSVRSASLGRKCISEAVATAPTGPFVDSSLQPLICQPAEGGSIDPSAFVDPATSASYLLWKSDGDAIGRPSRIWVQRLGVDGRSLTGPATALLTQNEPWQRPTIEGPTLARVGSRYYLFYGGNAWWTATSGIGYATCASVLGPCTNHSVTSPWLSSIFAIRGPQGPDVFTTPRGVIELAFASWSGTPGYANHSVRSLWIARLAFANGQPSLQ